MVLDCAWCGRRIAGPPAAAPRSHGICRPCLEPRLAALEARRPAYAPARPYAVAPAARPALPGFGS